MRAVEDCPACASRRWRVQAAAGSRELARFRSYSAVKYDGLLDDWLGEAELRIGRCARCGHHWYFHQPEPDQLSAMYAAGRPLHAGATPDRAPTPAMCREMQRLRGLVDSDNPCLLDFGSGFGRWARAAVREGFKVCAYEPSRERGWEEHPQFALVHEREALRGMVFDVVNLEQVLEHVTSPVDLLRDIGDLCHSSTLLRITVPNILRCPEGSRLWSEWPYDGQRAHTMAPFEHLHGFTPASLMHSVRCAGFEPLQAARLMTRYPWLVVRSWLGRCVPVLGQTLIIVSPVRAKGGE